jgi:TRAP transporter TAXI family solute receptor
MSSGEIFDVDAGLRRRLRRVRFTLLAALVAVLAAGVVLWRTPAQRQLNLRVSAGSSLGHRADIARALAEIAKTRGIDLQYVPTEGSVESLEALADRTIDIALVQGGLPPAPDICHVATLVPEPLHLLVRPTSSIDNVADLAGKTVNLSTSGSGTRWLALEVLDFAGIEPQSFVDQAMSYEQLQQCDPSQLPDAVFIVSSLPSSMAEWLVRARGYQLVELPYGPALAVRNRNIQHCEIPSFTYSVEPPHPASAVQSVATQLELLVRSDLDESTAKRLAECIFDDGFARLANLPAIEPRTSTDQSAYDLHPGIVTYLRRDNPLLTSESIEYVENARSFLVSAAIALALLYRWYSRRLATGFEKHLDLVTHVELDVLKLLQEGQLTGERLAAEEVRLSRLKAEALEQFAAGRLKGEEHLSSFLTHVADVRQLLRNLQSAAQYRAKS